MLSTEKPKIIPLVVARIGLPIVFGLMIELACDLLKHVVRYFSTSIYSEVNSGIWEELKESNVWIGLAFAIALVALSTWVLDGWRWADPRRWVRTGLLLVSVIVAGVVDPSGHIFREKLLDAFGRAQVGERMPIVLGRIEYASPSLVWPHKDSGNPLDCIGKCWIRLTYDLPVVFGERRITFDFDRDQTLIRKDQF
jgi:hypothetical protein